MPRSRSSSINGGVIGKTNRTSFGKDTITKVTSSGCHSLQSGTSLIDVAVAAGGAGGGLKGGGGAGGLQILQNQTTAVGGSIPITIGAGGAKASCSPASSAQGKDGSDTVFGNAPNPITSTGGGGGGGDGSSPGTADGRPGGSGGGGGSTPNSISPSNKADGGTGTPGGGASTGGGGKSRGVPGVDGVDGTGGGAGSQYSNPGGSGGDGVVLVNEAQAGPSRSSGMWNLKAVYTARIGGNWPT